jgi:hypothetical protein
MSSLDTPSTLSLTENTLGGPVIFNPHHLGPLDDGEEDTPSVNGQNGDAAPAPGQNADPADILRRFRLILGDGTIGKITGANAIEAANFYRLKADDIVKIGTAAESVANNFARLVPSAIFQGHFENARWGIIAPEEVGTLMSTSITGVAATHTQKTLAAIVTKIDPSTEGNVAGGIAFAAASGFVTFTHGAASEVLKGTPYAPRPPLQK